MGEKEPRGYPCEVREVFSGDDLVLMVDLGVEGLHKKQRVRLHGVDTPNAIKAAPNTSAGEIRNYVRRLTWRRPGHFEVVSRNVGSWVGILTVSTPTGQVNVNQDLIGKGYQYAGKREIT